MERILSRIINFITGKDVAVGTMDDGEGMQNIQELPPDILYFYPPKGDTYMYLTALVIFSYCQVFSNICTLQASWPGVHLFRYLHIPIHKYYRTSPKYSYMNWLVIPHTSTWNLKKHAPAEIGSLQKNYQSIFFLVNISNTHWSWYCNITAIGT